MISLHTQTQYAKPVSVFKTVNKISKGFSKTTVCVDIAYEMRVLREWRDFVKKKEIRQIWTIVTQSPV